MPAVYAQIILSCGDRNLKTRALLNTGGIDAELVIPESLSKKLMLEARGKVEIEFGGRSHLADVGSVEVIVEAGRRRRGAELEALVLPNEVLNKALIGVSGLEKLKITPDVVTGRVIFR